MGRFALRGSIIVLGRINAGLFRFSSMPFKTLATACDIFVCHINKPPSRTGQHFPVKYQDPFCRLPPRLSKTSQSIATTVSNDLSSCRVIVNATTLLADKRPERHHPTRRGWDSWCLRLPRPSIQPNGSWADTVRGLC